MQNRIIYNKKAQVTHVASRTTRRALNKQGYSYCQSRKKVLLTAMDLKKRTAFANKAKGYAIDFWENGITFYLDGVGFAHKTNPCSEARAASMS